MALDHSHPSQSAPVVDVGSAEDEAQAARSAELVADAKEIVGLIKKARSNPVVRRGESPVIYKRSTLMPWRELSYSDQRRQKEILFRHRKRSVAATAPPSRSK